MGGDRFSKNLTGLTGVAALKHSHLKVLPSTYFLSQKYSPVLVASFLSTPGITFISFSSVSPFFITPIVPLTPGLRGRMGSERFDRRSNKYKFSSAPNFFEYDAHFSSKMPLVAFKRNKKVNV